MTSANAAAGRRLTLIVPVFNEAKVLPDLLSAVGALAASLGPRGLQIELLLVDDGSTDGGRIVLADWLKSAAPAYEIRLIRLSRNFGKEVALSAGVDAADGDAVVMMDADLQHPIELVETFVAGWLDDGYDVVFGYRTDDGRESFAKRVFRSAFYLVVNRASDAAVEPHAGDFRLMSRRAYTALRQFPERERLMKGLYGLIGFRTKGVAYEPRPRAGGTSKYSWLKLWAAGLDGITSFSVLPLRLTTFMGVVLALLAFAYGVETIVEKLVFGIHVPGYPTLIVLISMIGAGQLIGMGIVGEYVGKILVEAKRRPLYIVESDDRLNGAAAPTDASATIETLAGRR